MLPRRVGIAGDGRDPDVSLCAVDVPGAGKLASDIPKRLWTDACLRLSRRRSGTTSTGAGTSPGRSDGKYLTSIDGRSTPTLDNLFPAEEFNDNMWVRPRVARLGQDYPESPSQYAYW